MFLGMPWQFWAIFAPGLLLLLALRLATWAARALGYGENPRPGYLDHTRRPR